jgi:hypothetical protein
MLRPRPTIILFGDEEGIAEVSREFGVIHVPSVARNSFGTPFVNGVFHEAEAMAAHQTMCYVNADIILMNDFTEAIRLCEARHGHWMMGGRPWDMEIQQPLRFDAGWQGQLCDEARRKGRQRWAGACDYFVYSKGLWSDLPPFALGRSYFDLALLHLARKQGADLIDASDFVTAVHQTHAYAAHLSGEGYTNNPEALENVRLAGGWEQIYTWKNATHQLTPAGVRRWWRGTARFWGHFSPRVRNFQNRYWYPVLAITRPIRRPMGLGLSNFLILGTRLNRLFRRNTIVP